MSIYEGNSDLAKENKLIREYEIEINPCKTGDAHIVVTFDFDEKGNFNVVSDVTYQLKKVALSPTVSKGMIEEDIGIAVGTSMSVIVPRGSAFPCKFMRKFANADNKPIVLL